MVYGLQLNVYIFCSTGTHKPTVKLWNRHIRSDIAKKWYDLGVELLAEKHHSILDNIAKNNPVVEDCCTELIKQWLKVDTDASWNKVIKALNNLMENNLAERIKRKILNGIIVTP